MLLACFIPAVVYMADAVGTETDTVVIQDLLSVAAFFAIAAALL